jgi:hypothetical protein
VYGQPALQVDLHPDQVIYFFYIPLWLRNCMYFEK